MPHVTDLFLVRYNLKTYYNTMNFRYSHVMAIYPLFYKCSLATCIFELILV